MKSVRAETTPPAESGAPVVVSRQQLAAILGVHPDRISEYTAAGCPVLHHGGVGGAAARRRSQYDAIACARWVRAHRPGTFDAQQEKGRRDRSLAELNELRLAERRKVLVPAAAVEQVVLGLVVQARLSLLGLPTKLRQKLPHLTASDAQTLDWLIRAILTQMAETAGAVRDAYNVMDRLVAPAVES